MDVVVAGDVEKDRGRIWFDFMLMMKQRRSVHQEGRNSERFILHWRTQRLTKRISFGIHLTSRRVKIHQNAKKCLILRGRFVVNTVIGFFFSVESLVLGSFFFIFGGGRRRKICSGGGGRRAMSWNQPKINEDLNASISARRVLCPRWVNDSARRLG